MATPQHSFQLGILPERKIDKRALATSYGFMVLVTFLLVNLGIVFPDRLQLQGVSCHGIDSSARDEAGARAGQGEAT